jgi:DNA polymerase-3 subunit epsilon
MYTFTAIDFETANNNPNSICQIGLVHFKDGVIIKEINLLVQPPRNYYWTNFIKVHGITPSMTAFAPSFYEHWALIKPYIADQHVVAHNASFDMNCLKHTLQHYHIPLPDFKTHCTYRIYKKGLAFLCQQHGIELQHHDALSDAKACAQLFVQHLQQQDIALF